MGERQESLRLGWVRMDQIAARKAPRFGKISENLFLFQPLPQRYEMDQAPVSMWTRGWFSNEFLHPRDRARISSLFRKA